MNNDNTFSVGLTFQIVEGGTSETVTESEIGTWSQKGDQVTFNFSSGTVFTGVSGGNRLTIVDDGVAFVYSK